MVEVQRVNVPQIEGHLSGECHDFPKDRQGYVAFDCIDDVCGRDVIPPDGFGDDELLVPG
jgi:hypothetical protein